MPQHDLFTPPTTMHRLHLEFTDHTVSALHDEVTLDIKVADVDKPLRTIGRVGYPGVARDLVITDLADMAATWMYGTERDLTRDIPGRQRAVRRYLRRYQRGE